MKKVIQIVLAVLVVVLVYVLIKSIGGPVDFLKAKDGREAAVIERIKDIRTAQRAYRTKYQRFTPSFDTLIDFVLHDSLTFKTQIGSKDDSVALARGEVYETDFNVAVKDTIFGGRKLTAQQVQDFPIIPFGEGKQFLMDAGNFKTLSEVTVPVVEVKAPYKDFLGDLDRQELINLIDFRKTQDRYPGIKFGSMTEANNEAGNWE